MSLAISEAPSGIEAAPFWPPAAGGHRSRRTAWRPGPGALGAAMLVGYGAIAIAAPLLAPFDPSAFVGRPLEWPSPTHWLGTNDAGQDILSEIIFGTRASLIVALVSSSASVLTALVVGTLAGYLRGLPDAVLMRLVDLVLTLPHLPLMIVLAAYLPPSLATTTVVISVLGWALPARVLRAQTLAIRGEPYVEAVEQLGARPPRVIRSHVLPSLGPILAATFVGQAGRAVALESGLAFLGLGDPLLKSWGGIMHAALSYRGIYFTPNWSWWLLPAGANVSLLILAFTLFGVGLEERFDPRLRRRRRS